MWVGRVNLGEEKDFIVDRRKQPTLFWTYGLGMLVVLAYLIWLGFNGYVSP